METSSPIPAAVAHAHAVAPPESPAGGTRLDRFALAGALVVAIAHDLRQPLAAVEMNVAAALQFLRRPVPSSEAAMGALEAALDEERRMRDAVQVLLELAMKRQARREACDVGVALQQALTLVQSEALARGVTIDVDAPATLPLVFGDLVLLRQAFVGLLLEAIEIAAREGHPAASVRLTVRRIDGAIVVDAAYPGQAAADGTGEWQLALVRSVVEAHEGELAVSIVPDGTTRVETRWPLHAR